MYDGLAVSEIQDKGAVVAARIFVASLRDSLVTPCYDALACRVSLLQWP